MRTSVKILSGIFAVAGIGGLAAPVLARPMTQSAADQTVNKETVSYRDLNIANQAGAKRLYERIAIAAENVCGIDDEGVALLFDRNYRACKDEAIADAVNRVDQPRLTAIMDQHITSQELALARKETARG